MEFAWELRARCRRSFGMDAYCEVDLTVFLEANFSGCMCRKYLQVGNRIL
jgi:hypothetical protein